MNNIDTSIIYNIINFLLQNENFGDDWDAEIAELNKVIDAVDGKRENQNKVFSRADKKYPLFSFVYLIV